MHLVFVGNYPPRQCGIATFTQHLANGIAEASQMRGMRTRTSVVAINDKSGYAYPPEVLRTIDQQNRKDYIQTAEYINRSDADVVVLQHEFGIFGGEAGAHILGFAERLRKPLIVTLHTVLRQPNDQQRLIIQRLGALSQRLIVMSQLAVRMLHQVYRIPMDRISCIEHGAPAFDYSRRPQAREALGLDQRHTLLTFGHLGRGKGIETAIEALPALKEVCPDFLYILLGKTHPHVLAHEGETYRDRLWTRVEELGLAQNVRFDDIYADETMLADYLLAADTYVLPYPNEAQITSGTLSYAIGAGCAVVSTPFWHARELLQDGRGLYFGFGDSRKLGEQLQSLIASPELQRSLRAKAKAYGQHTTWAMQGGAYLDLMAKVTKTFSVNQKQARRTKLPAIDLQHILRLTDDTGMLQHATYHLPNRQEGYCLDDNARALIFAVQCLERGLPRTQIEPLLDRYLGLLHYLQRPDGLFHNFIGYDRNFLEKVGSEDSHGRAVWALGVLLASEAVSQDHKDLAWQLYLGARGHIAKLRSLRAVAYSVMGICTLATSEQYSEGAADFADTTAEFLILEFDEASDKDWAWFEQILSYGNAVLPLALLMAGRVCGRQRYLDVAEETTRFLETYTFEEHMLHPIGCNGFMRRGDPVCRYDQQPIDAGGMVLLYSTWYAHTQDARDLNRATICYEWFTGHNDLGLGLFHAERGSCYDGLMERGLNQNQGAESTLAFWLARNFVAQALSLEQSNERSPDRWANPFSADLQQQLNEAVSEHSARTEAA